MDTKLCSECGAVKPLTIEYFYFRQGKSNGSKCIECVKLAANMYYAENKEKILPVMHLYANAHKEKINAHAKVYRQENKEEIAEKKKIYNSKEEVKLHKKEYNHKYRQENREKILEQKKTYNAENAEHIALYQKDYRDEHEEEILEYRKNYYHDNKNDPVYKMRRALSRAVWAGLHRNDSSKAGESSIAHLNAMINGDYITLLWQRLEAQFESWMTKENQGLYVAAEWDDKDQTTWRWNLDHIIPHCRFNYQDMDCQEFHDCWALENLRPISAKQNTIEGDSRTDEEIMIIKGDIAALLQKVAMRKDK